MARPPSSTSCCRSPAPSARTRGSPSAPWIRTISSGSAASPSWPSAPRCMEGHSHQHRRHARPRRFRRRGGAHPQHGGRRRRAGGRGRGADAADQVRGLQGAEARAASPSSPSTRSTSPTRARSKWSTRCSTSSPRSTPPTSSSISRSSTVRPSRAGWPTTPRARRTDLAPLFDLVLKHVRAAEGGGRTVPDARHHPRGQPLPRAHRHGPHHAPAR